MLARLDAIPGVASSRVDWTGKRFLLVLEPGAAAGPVTSNAAEALGAGASALGERDTNDAIAGFRSGEAWMRAGETVRLSRHEATVLAERYGAEAASELALDDGARKKLVSCIERELAAAFERVHQRSTESAAETPPLRQELEAAGARILEASRAFLDPAQCEKLEIYLARLR